MSDISYHREPIVPFHPVTSLSSSWLFSLEQVRASTVKSCSCILKHTFGILLSAVPWLLAPRSELVVLYINYSIKLAFGPLTALSPRKLKLKIWFQTQCQSQQVKLHCSENSVASAVFDSLTHSRALRENRGSPSQSLTLCSALLRCGTSHQQTTWCKESFISLTQRQVTCSASSDACLLIPELL